MGKRAKIKTLEHHRHHYRHHMVWMKTYVLIFETKDQYRHNTIPYWTEI